MPEKPTCPNPATYVSTLEMEVGYGGLKYNFISKSMQQPVRTLHLPPTLPKTFPHVSPPSRFVPAPKQLRHALVQVLNDVKYLPPLPSPPPATARKRIMEKEKLRMAPSVWLCALATQGAAAFAD